MTVHPLTVKELLDRFYRKCVCLSLSRGEIAVELRKLADELEEKPTTIAKLAEGA